MQTFLSSKTAAGVEQSAELSLHVLLARAHAPAAQSCSVRGRKMNAIKVGAVESAAKCSFSKSRNVLHALMPVSP